MNSSRIIKVLISLICAVGMILGVMNWMGLFMSNKIIKEIEDITAGDVSYLSRTCRINKIDFYDLSIAYKGDISLHINRLTAYYSLSNVLFQPEVRFFGENIDLEGRDDFNVVTSFLRTIFGKQFPDTISFNQLKGNLYRSGKEIRFDNIVLCNTFFLLRGNLSYLRADKTIDVFVTAIFADTLKSQKYIFGDDMAERIMDAGGREVEIAIKGDIKNPAININSDFIKVNIKSD